MESPWLCVNDIGSEKCPCCNGILHYFDKSIGENDYGFITLYGDYCSDCSYMKLGFKHTNKKWIANYMENAGITELKYIGFNQMLKLHEYQGKRINKWNT